MFHGGGRAARQHARSAKLPIPIARSINAAGARSRAGSPERLAPDAAQNRRAETIGSRGPAQSSGAPRTLVRRRLADRRAISKTGSPDHGE